ncbi:MAG: hypothetical protein ACRDPY_09645 [Streptosporangiaceae bacterium]
METITGKTAAPSRDDAVSQSGRLPWTGTRARSREIGYGAAMYEMFQLLAKICHERPYLEPFLGPVRSHAYDCWWLSDPDGTGFDWTLNHEGLRPGDGSR